MVYNKLNLRNGTTLNEAHFDYLENGIGSFSNKLSGKKVAILGDSISSYKNITCASNYPVHYPTQDVTSVDKTWWGQVISKTGMILSGNSSIAGSSITSAVTYPTVSSMSRIRDLSTNGTPEIILVYAGTNDIGAQSGFVEHGTLDFDNLIKFKTLSDTPPALPQHLTEAQINDLEDTTFVQGCVALFIRLQYMYPNATILCMLPNFTWKFSMGGDTYYGNSYVRMRQFCDTMRELCDYFGIYVIDTRKAGISMMDEGLLWDGVHPNASGMTLIAQYVYNALMSHYYFPLTYSKFTGATTPSDTPSGTTSTTTWYIDYRNQRESLDKSASHAGKGWGYDSESDAGSALIGKPINTIHLFTDLETQTLTFAKASKGATSTTLIENVTANKASDGDYTIFNIPETTLQNGEMLIILPSDQSGASDNVQFFYSSK